MKRYLYIILIAVIVNTIQQSYGQNKKIDSLQTLLNATKEDTARLRLYLKLGDVCDMKDNLKYAIPALKLADKLLSQTINDKEKKNLLKQKARIHNYIEYFYQDKKDTSKMFESIRIQLSIYQEIKDTTQIIQTILDFGYHYYIQGIGVSKALEYYQKGLLMCKEWKYKKGIATFLSQIGELYSNQGDREQALVNYQKALSIYDELKDTATAAYTFVTIGYIYSNMHNVTKSLEYLNKAMYIYEKNKNKEEIRNVYSVIGLMYLNNDNLPNALEVFKKTISLTEELNAKLSNAEELRSNKTWMRGLLGNIGETYMKQGDIVKAIEYYSKSLKVAEELKDSMQIAWPCSELSRSYLLQKNYKNAIYYSNRYLAILAAHADYVESIRDAEQIAEQIDSACGNLNGAYKHYKKYIMLRDKLNSEEVRKAAIKEKFQEEADKQKLEQDKKDVIAVAESRKQRIITGSVIGGLLIVLVFAVFVLRSLRITRKQKQIIEMKSKETEQQKIEVEKQKQLVEEHQKEIVDSITYAKRLQQAILPTVAAVKEQLPDSFIYYQPKDIVAGDFYWMHTAKDTVYIAAADCTGHGVPGAMVSVVCSNALNRAVNEFNLTDTGKILDKTRQLVIETFEKSDSEVKDGMDISLLRVDSYISDTGNVNVQWSGANNSLWYIIDTELVEVKADKQPIGKYSEPRPFATNSFNLQSPITFYLFSDGYADQFSPDDKKLMKKKFKDIVLSMQNLSMDEQKERVEQVHVDWKGTMEQTDDVLVIGVKL